MGDILLLAGTGTRLSVQHGLLDFLETASGMDAASRRLRIRVVDPENDVNDWTNTGAIIVLPGDDFPLPDAAQDALRAAACSSVLLGSVCVGTFRLASTGLLDGRRATTHWSAEARFRTAFPKVYLDPTQTLIDEVDLITAGGLMAWVDLGLALVRRFLGPEIMHETARFMLADPGARDQRAYASFRTDLNHGDAPVRAVQEGLQRNLATPHSIINMAADAGLTRRTFLRRFKSATGLTPTTYLQKLRVEQARRLLEQESMPVEEIAWSVGYGDTGAFRAVFLREIGETPSAYRRRCQRRIE
ncbi:hypothetical protein BWR17_19170 (plasmid) [Phaeobacter inhibens]|uniref:GlxA family transcriptional regulator n=1 Tax=Phaeobacter inhibens TaxID=221822 RepID=UPI0009718AED|nr:helix-turn-helix domain-containing protein [Phaeobacter inhibens]APX18013.1 hypothetical protein BWR17_19170 [Phaeobacter inhibens]